jgi:hypothetical protein
MITMLSEGVKKQKEVVLLQQFNRPKKLEVIFLRSISTYKTLYMF